MLLDGKVAVISGAASPRGIGLATARLFAEHGARVAIFDLDASAAAEAAAGLGAGIRASPATSPTARAASARRARRSRRSAQVDMLINNAGITQPVKIMEIDAREWDAVLDVNLRGVLNLSQALIPHLRERKPGLDRLHVVGLGAARRRHLRRPALQRGQGRRARPRQGDGARARPRRHPRQLRDARA